MKLDKMNQYTEKLETFGQVEIGTRLKDITTMRIGGKAEFVSYPRNILALAQLIDFLNNNDIAYKIIGKIGRAHV